MNAVYLTDALRTPVGKRGGAFAKTRPDTLAIDCLRELRKRHPVVDFSRVGDVIIGCAMPEAEQGLNLARQVAVLSGLPESVPGMTVNRFCSSGLQSIALAADRIRLGEADLMIAGGVESMSLVPMTGHRPAIHPAVSGGENQDLAYSMGITAEQVAHKYQVSRQDQDEFALRSHQRAVYATDEGRFSAEILPVHVSEQLPDAGKDGYFQTRRSTVEHDEGPRRDTSAEALARLKPVFAREGSVTAGNSSQMSDGAGMVLLASERAVEEYHLRPLARFAGFAVAGVPPRYMGIGPVEALPKALSMAGALINNLEWIELNEAFAAQSLAVMRALELDPDKVNPCGGAIALGHPLGATGALRTATAVHGLRATLAPGASAYAAVTMCIGQGMGAAGIFEVYSPAAGSPDSPATDNTAST